MRKRIISMLLLASIVFSSVSATPVFAANESTVEQTEKKELYTVGNTSYENGASTTKGNGHDCQQLGIWIPANTTFRIRQTNLDLKQKLTIRMRNNDSQTEATYTIPENGDWLEITPKADSVPFISSIYRSDNQKPAVEFSVAGAKKLPVYTKGDDEKAFFKEWDDSDAPYAVYESEYAIFLVPKCDKKANKLGTLNDLCQYYDNMIRQYNEFAGLSKSEDAEVWNKDSGTRYFIKANKHGAGAAYYSVIETATNSASMAGYMEYNWGSLHEVGHGYNTIGFNSAEIWNNVFGYYYQMATLGKSTWLGMTEQNRAGYEKERQANGYDGNDYGTKLYFWVNMFDKIGPKQAISYSYQKYRSNRYHGISSLSGYTYYADAFAEATGYNVFPYFELWGRPVDETAKQNIIQAGVYKNVYPLRNLTQTDETADQIKAQLGLASRYNLVETEALVNAVTDVAGTLNIQLDDASYEALKGKEIKITDGIHTVKTLNIDEQTMEVSLPIGVYNVLVDKSGVNSEMLLEHLIGDAVIVEGEKTDYQITATAVDSTELSGDMIAFNGLGDSRFFTATLDMAQNTLKLVTDNKQPHVYFDSVYTSIEVFDENGAQVYYKEHYGNKADPDNKTIDIKEGYRIKIYHAEPGRLIVRSAITPEVTLSPGTKTSEYEITKYGLKRILPSETDEKDTYFSVLCQYMDNLIKEHEKADFQNNNKLQEEKAKVNAAYQEIGSSYQEQFKEKYQGYYPFDQGIQSAVIGDILDQTYTGEEIKPELEVSENGKRLEENVDYTVTYLNNINIGTAKAIVYGMGEHASLYGEKSFQITLSEEEKVFTVVSAVPSYSFTGGAKRPEATVSYRGKVLKKGVDYNLFHINNTDVGTATITATGIGNYRGFYGEGTFEITRQTVEFRVSCSPEKLVYTGVKKEVSVSVDVDNRVLTEGKDFVIDRYENNTEVGTASVYVKGIGNYEGVNGSGTFEIIEPQIVPINGNEFSNWEMDMLGYSDHLFSHILFDIKNQKIQVDTEAGQPHQAWYKQYYAYIKVFDASGNEVYYKKYVGTQDYEKSSDSISVGLGYTVEIYHGETWRGKIYASENEPVIIPMVNLATYEITTTGLQKLDAAAEEDSMSLYYQNIIASMNVLIQENAKEDFKDELKLTEEKNRIEQSLTLLPSEKLEQFKEKYKDYYPFHAVEVEYRVSYDWGMEYPSDQVLPEDSNVYSSEEEAMKAMDTTYTNNSSVRGSKDDKTGVWRFSGWNGSCDETTHIVTYRGIWSFEEDKTATINYRIENGTWDGENAEDKTEIVTLTDGKGVAAQIPTGMVPSEGYEGGAWNTDPTMEISGDVIFIYSFTKIEEEPETRTVTVTFKIENGTWADQSTEDIEKEVALTDGVGTLASDEIPSGMLPNEGYDNGSWNVDPTTAISGDVTFIYSFTKIEEEPETRIVTVTFKVENGTWENQSTEDIVKEVELADGVVRLDEIPSGMLPNEGYEGGSWNIDPATEIRGDITFIYSFTQKKEEPEPRTATVTFKIENGTWEDQTTDDIVKEVELVDGVGVLGEIPINMIPNEGYEGGSWNIDPATEIRGDITFIYSFTQKKEEPEPQPEPEPEPEPEPQPEPEPEPEPEPQPEPQPEPEPTPQPQPEIQPEQDKKNDAASGSSSGKSHTSHHSDSGEAETPVTDSQNETTNDTEQNVMETANENTVVSEIASTPAIPDQPEEQAVEELSDQPIEEVAEEEPSEESVEEVAEEESGGIQENEQDQPEETVSQKDNWGLFVFVAAVCAVIFLAGGFILYKKRRN